MTESSIEALAQQVLEQIFVELEASARHVHLTEAQAVQLFGHGLTAQRALSQPGQYVARERVMLVGPKGEFAHVAVLGPTRARAQVEVSLTDARALGICAPIRPSGKVADSPGIVVRGTAGELALEQGVIVAQRHVHMTPQDARRYGVRDGQTVKLQTLTERPVTFAAVQVRVSEDFATRAHLDLDEANACAMKPGDLGRIVV